MSTWDNETRFVYHETGRPTNAQKAAAWDEAQKRISDPRKLAETRRWIYAKTRTVSQIRGLFIRWGMQLPQDAFREAGEK